MYRVDPQRRELVAEFLEHPFGPHSAALQRLVLHLRATQPAGKLVALTVERHARWRIGLYDGKRGTPILPCDDVIHASLADINRAIFILQWQAATGETWATEDR